MDRKPNVPFEAGAEFSFQSGPQKRKHPRPRPPARVTRLGPDTVLGPDTHLGPIKKSL